ncbi:unnamed protein product [Closterium sp. Naga37s-1]|nr:unnamed protein product [Closterium sp. Naga37s-1]
MQHRGVSPAVQRVSLCLPPPPASSLRRFRGSRLHNPPRPPHSQCPSPPDSSVAPPAPGGRGVPSTFLISQAPPFRRRLRPRPFFPLLPRVLRLGPHGSALLPRSGSRRSAPLVRPVALFPPGSTLPRRLPLFLVPQMEVDALAIVATALAHSSPGGVPGRQAPALLRAASALAGHGASSRPSRERRVQGRRSRDPVFRSPPGRAPACLRPRQQQMFRRSQRPPIPPPRSGRRPALLIGCSATGAVGMPAAVSWREAHPNPVGGDGVSEGGGGSRCAVAPAINSAIVSSSACLS